MKNMSLTEIVDELPICELVNTNDSPFWYVRVEKDKFAARYVHEKGKKRDCFYDGNNGDCWQVLAIDTTLRRAIVENQTQGGMRYVWWQ